MTFKISLFFAFCIHQISCEAVNETRPMNMTQTQKDDEAIEKCVNKFDLSRQDLEYWSTFGVLQPGKEEKMCVFECMFKVSDQVDSNSVPNQQKMIDFFRRQIKQPTNGTDSDQLVQSIELLFEKCPPKLSSSPCDIVSNFATCTADVARIIYLKRFLFGSDEFRNLDAKSQYNELVVPAVNECKLLQTIEKDSF